MTLSRNPLVAGILVLAVLDQAACRRQSIESRPADLRYVVGPAWLSTDQAWFYPEEQFSGSFTGLAVVEADHDPGGLTADGEARDLSMPQAAIQSLQLPIILIVTNLENGREISLRANDRGPQSPGRLIALNKRAAEMLDMSPVTATRVRVDIDQRLSEAAIIGLPGRPGPNIAAAPEPRVDERPLDNPFGSAGPLFRSSDGREEDANRPINVNDILRVETIRSQPVRPTVLWVDIGSFSSQLVAHEVASSTGGTDAAVRSGPTVTSIVRSGPFASIAEADAALKRAHDRGQAGAKIVVEEENGNER